MWKPLNSNMEILTSMRNVEIFVSDLWSWIFRWESKPWVCCLIVHSTTEEKVCSDEFLLWTHTIRHKQSHKTSSCWSVVLFPLCCLLTSQTAPSQLQHVTAVNLLKVFMLLWPQHTNDDTLYQRVVCRCPRPAGMNSNSHSQSHPSSVFSSHQDAQGSLRQRWLSHQAFPDTHR